MGDIPGLPRSLWYIHRVLICGTWEGCSRREGGKIGALDKRIKDTMCCLWRCWKSVQDRNWSVLLLYSDIVEYDSLHPMDCNTQGFPVLHYLLGFAQTHVHWVNDAIKPPHPLSHPSPPALSLSCIKVFSSESALCIRVKNIGASASASVLPMNIQGCFPVGLTALFSLPLKGLNLLQHHRSKASILWPSLWSNSHIYMTTEKTIILTIWNLVGKMMSLLNTLSRCVIVFFPRTKCLNFLAVVMVHSDWSPRKYKVCHCFHFFPIYLS